MRKDLRVENLPITGLDRIPIIQKIDSRKPTVNILHLNSKLSGYYRKVVTLDH